MPSNGFAAIEQADVAFLESGGVAYRCYVWQRNAEYLEGESRNFRGAAVEGRIVVEQEHGQSVVIWQGVVRTAPAGEHIDCVRVVARGSTFACHWIEYDEAEADASDPRLPDGRDIHRATFDVTATPYAWTQQGSITTSPYHLYDIHQDVEGDDYVMAHLVDADTISVRRVNGDAWVDTEWITVEDVSSRSADQNILAAAKIGTTNAAVVWQTGGQLAFLGLDWSDGAVEGVVTILAAVGQILAAGMCRGDGTAGETFVVLEYLPSSGGYGSPDYPWTLHFETSAGSPAGNPSYTVTPGTTLSSKPWRYTSPASTAADVPHFFAVLSHMQSQPGQEYQQSNHYVARYERAASSYSGRPIPVATINQGLAQAEKHGTAPLAAPAITQPVLSSTGAHPRRRRNHLPHATPAPSVGPLVKSYTTVLGRWSRIESSSDGLYPAGAAFRACRYHHEDPWLTPNDETNPVVGTENYASTATPHLEHAPAGDGLFIAGGTPQTYDGVRFVEAGFAWHPEILEAEEQGSGTAIGALGDVMQYTAVYEWRDAKGQLHRSAPAVPVSVTLAASGSVLVAISTIALSLKDSAAYDADLSRPIKIALYRTLANGSTFYPIFSGLDGNNYEAHDAPPNVTDSDNVTVDDGRADSVIQQGIPLPYTYTAGAWSPLPPSPIPALTSIAKWQNRVFGVSAEEPNRIWYSQEILPEYGGEQFTVPEFSPALTYRVDGIGPITAMVPMDSALIVFCRDSIYSLAGLPADSNGTNATLQLQTLQRNTGCINPRSVASSPNGVYFQARRGFYLLTRQNGLEYIGAPVEDEIRAAGLVRAVTVHEDSHQCRVLINGAPTGDPRVLVYDTLIKMWSEWPLPSLANTAALSAAQDAVVWRGHDGELAHVVLAQGGLGVQKASTSASLYADEGAGDPVVALPVDVRTDWIKLAGVAGFKRVRKIGLQMTKPAAAGLTVEIEYDLDGTFTDGANLQTETIATPAPEYIELRTQVQKCNAIRLRIYEDTADPTGDALTSSTLNLHAITFVVGRKPGLRRVSPSTQRT